MIVAADAQNQVVGSQVDFDHHVAGRHFLHQTDRIFFQHDRRTVADALGVSALDGFTDVVREIFGLHEPGRDLSRMQRDVNLGINAVEVIEHRHVLVKVVYRNVPVFRLNQIQAHKMGIG